MGHSLLQELAFQPRLPVGLMEFADPDRRRSWIEEKGLQVFSISSDRFPSLVVDLFAEPPFSFAGEWERAAWIAFPDASTRLPFVSRETLLDMKRAADRPVDREDVRHLSYLQDDEV